MTSIPMMIDHCVHIDCAICKKPVDVIQCEVSGMLPYTVKITVECHGDKDTMQLDERAFMMMTKRDFERGVAFTTPRIKPAEPRLQ